MENELDKCTCGEQDKCTCGEQDECTCGEQDEYGDEGHTCPYAEEINGDCESLCNCCSYCTQQCAWDI